ncbi:hypothetical protein E3P89_01511 [Wallemia ichthyophaga]|uniref:Palmitoyl-protein thioesterase 1 n=1 Tax=Wallemia ichthyophaga TaxID=245174 RepID=A0A4T0HFA4_WALIC|nr:hypothetical protein E3P90_01903 [Wallemia ichthyophaga]TIB14470.1 hypothetical protein E3P93_01653 [Wallemia ichthyophaga]TIB23528.1 hypothetical protein E3P89_01511 [Wallemia ichthyophaga]TIB24865.1 hypothetical protein E3P88_01858 [Wallemia ichthyophaga]
MKLFGIFAAVANYFLCSVQPPSPPLSSAPENLPILVWGGLGDSVLSSGMEELMGELSERYDTRVYGVSIGDTPSEDRRLSGLSDANYNVQVACSKLSQLDNTPVNAIGLSQGGLFLRAVIEQCPEAPSLRHLVTFGTPHMGIERLPRCAPRDWVCAAVALVTRWGVYTAYAQSHAVVAQYYRDPTRYAEYLRKSTWLAGLNSERALIQEGHASYSPKQGDRLAALESFTAVMFSGDTTVTPKQSAWFGSSNVSRLSNVSSEGESSEIVPLEQQPIYTHPLDPLGLRRLNEQGRLHLKACDGRHLNLTDACMWPILDGVFDKSE